MKVARAVMICILVSTLIEYGNSNGVQSSSPSDASRYLANVMDQYHKTFDVYTDSHAGGNHFAARGRISSTGDEDAVSSMNEASIENPHSGMTCIEAAFKSKRRNWGGWYFMNGVLQGEEADPKENWGDYPDAGIDLRGATKLTFWARGAKGGESVEFFALGVGRDPDTGFSITSHPDSSPKVSTGYVTLSVDWRQYTIDVRKEDLSYVLGGFGWVTSALENYNRDITFYIDDIQYNKSRLKEPRFLVSYETMSSDNDFDVVMRNVAFSYDNAVALLAFLASGQKERAKLLADAFVYTQQHDRSYDDGRIRNAYQGGDLVLPPGWTPHGRTGTVRLPGWYGAEGRWQEDELCTSTYTGNVSWVILALLAYYETAGGDQYLTAAEQMGEWVEHNCRDTQGAGGYTAGFEGREPNSIKITYKATEHNIDVYAAFLRLYLITGDNVWLERATHAKKFVLAMWDSREEKFWTGTRDDGKTINKEVIPLDIQAWAVLALGDEGKSYWKALEYVETHHRVEDGFDFDEDRDSVWYEGTAHMAVAYYATDQKEKWQHLVSFLEAAQFASGGLPEANNDRLTTGFYLSGGSPWLYFRRVHVGATGWLVLVEWGLNPFISKESVKLVDEKFQEAKMAFDEENYELARQLFEQAKSMYGSMGNSEKVSECQDFIDKCAQLLEQRQLRDEAQAFFEDGGTYFNQERYDLAKKKFEEALAVFKELHDEEWIKKCEEKIILCEEKIRELEEKENGGFCVGSLLIAIVLLSGILIHILDEKEANYVWRDFH